MAIEFITPMSCFAKKAARKIVKLVPSVTVKDGKLLDGIKWAGQHISSPQNRLILGASALLSQPFIDLHNKRVDEDTRKSSAARTVAKILVGTATGFLVRYYTIKAVEAFTLKPVANIPKYKSIFFPKGIKNTTINGLKHYKMALGSFLALLVMLFTNFAIDAPLTKRLTNYFIDRLKLNKSAENTKVPLKNSYVDYFERENMDTFIKKSANRGDING